MMSEEIFEELDRFNTPEEAVKSGRFLFHGTIDEFNGPLKPGGYDGVIWTADTPSVAQTYIPENGVETLLYYQDFYADDYIRPALQDPWWKVVARMMGADIEACDATYDHMGIATSWKRVGGHPTYREARSFVESMGYQFNCDNNNVWIKTTYEDDQEILLPADFKRQGRLFILLKDSGLNFLDLRDSSEGDLLSPDYHRIPEFRKAEADGYDGVIINDFAQSRRFGNVGHVSWGLFRKVVEKLPYLEIPAVAYDWQDSLNEDGGVTPDFRTAFEVISQKKRHEQTCFL